MANLSGFDASTIAPREDFTPLPAGEYRVVIVDSDMKPTKKNDGQYLEVSYEVIEGEYKGRKLWSRHNLDNPNQKTVEIAQRELSAICHAVGILQPRDSQQLHNKPLSVRVEFIPADGFKQQKDGNEIKAWKAVEGGAQTSAPQHPAPVAATGAAPWKRNAA